MAVQHVIDAPICAGIINSLVSSRWFGHAHVHAHDMSMRISSCFCRLRLGGPECQPFRSGLTDVCVGSACRLPLRFAPQNAPLLPHALRPSRTAVAAGWTHLRLLACVKL
jgi:hypothetical protein